MMLTALRRVVRAGVVNVWRNSFVSLASIFVMTMTVSIIGSLIFFSALIDQFVAYVQDKVDVNVYFTESADERAILDLKAALEALPEVSYVTYATRQDVLDTFRARHQDDRDIVGALDELGENPFGASLSIKAKDSSRFESIYQFVKDRQERETGPTLIKNINYERNRAVIEQITRVTEYGQRFGFVITLVFIIASILITFNTIRLAIYTAREEIGVMRLVGATNMYIRGPFVIEGTLYGVVAGVVSLCIFFPLTLALRGASEAMFNADIFWYYLSNLWFFILVLVCVGAVLGAVSSYLAVRKYLSV
jgi:cell division transport system permease protein